MVIRNHSRSTSFRRVVLLLAVVLSVAIMSWENHRTDAAIVGGSIPEESIRLRILAHSDAPQDQAVKRYVRDAIVAEMERWSDEPQTIEEARRTLRAKLPELGRIVRTVLADRGFAYGYRLELGQVDFPTKMYGSEVYPAGEYEALLVTLGEGSGQNWWCVLFPPLCFIDGVTGEAAAAPADHESGSADAVPAAAAVGDAGAGAATDEEVEVRFFLWDVLQAIVDFVRNLF
ncbi:stage II sporulation protein R [Paenibacillus sp. IB182496]|uniref:Stage II sporulation protein R n=1 Tax=Paenibacillus sabuli TaxID=2772509 RepID=A0A927BUI6_9BACL|nr:stage II sporulation protein R [Paenibacillus sabuli]MBD2845905.1 stage II sporulation protein R [Paenibacillus sabuli]